MLLWLCIAAALVLLFSFVCYRLVFYVPPRPPVKSDAVPLPKGAVYEPFHEQMTRWILEMRDMPAEEFHIRSFDGLDLYAHFYEYAPGAPVELMFHGYRGSAERDMAGGVQRCFALGRSAMLVDQRCSGKSGGSAITFGIWEHQDCIDWANFAADHRGSRRKTPPWEPRNRASPPQPQQEEQICRPPQPASTANALPCRQLPRRLQKAVKQRNRQQKQLCFPGELKRRRNRRLPQITA